MIIYNPIQGIHVPLEDVSDPVFAQKMMGEGVAILPESKLVVAPISGTLTTVFPTKHAFGIEGENGEEVLIHIGINTVELDGQFFNLHVAQDDIVKAGDPLVTVDFDAIKKAGYDIVTPIIILNTADYASVKDLGTGSMAALEPILELTK